LQNKLIFAKNDSEGNDSRHYSKIQPIQIGILEQGIMV